MKLEILKKHDPELYASMEKEFFRQQDGIELIASENYTSLAVMEACGSHLTNKYAEGYPKKRYYGGCEFVDEVEQIAIDRLKTLFGAEHANVQPHSGSQANMGVYIAALNVGDKVLGMNLSDGGHLTHGSPVNFSGTLYNFISYGVDKNGFIDYDALREQALLEKPKMIVAGASAYSRIIDFKRFREIADEISAYLLVDMAHIAGLVAAGFHPSPVPYADFVTSTTHKTLRGPRGGFILCKAEFAKKIDKAIFPGIQGGPLEHIIAGKAVCFKEAASEQYKDYIKNVVSNSKLFADELKSYGFDIVSGGTDNHLLLVDLRSKNITGKDAEILLDSVHITTNKNTVPNETQSPFVTSGIRIGTAAITSRGFGEAEVKEIASIINDVISNPDYDKNLAIKRVKNLCERFPLYQ